MALALTKRIQSAQIYELILGCIDPHIPSHPSRSYAFSADCKTSAAFPLWSLGSVVGRTACAFIMVVLRRTAVVLCNLFF